MSTGRPRILVVDDFPGITEVLAALLPRCAVEGATCGADALKLARSRPYDLYVLDFDLPDMSAEVCCRNLRDSDPNALIVVHTRRAPPTCIGDVPWSAWIGKSADTEALVQRVYRLLREQELINESATELEVAAISRELELRSDCTSHRTARCSARLEAMRDRIRASWNEHCRRDVLVKAFNTYVSGGGTRSGFIDYWRDVVATMAEVPTQAGVRRPPR